MAGMDSVDSGSVCELCASSWSDPPQPEVPPAGACEDPQQANAGAEDESGASETTLLAQAMPGGEGRSGESVNEQANAQAKTSQSADNGLFTIERAQQTGLQLPGYALMTPDAKPIVPEGAGSSWVLRKVDVDPSSLSSAAVNGAQGDPLRLGMEPADLNGSTTSAEHALGARPDRSPFLSASERPYGAANFSPHDAYGASPNLLGLMENPPKPAEPFLIDLHKAKANGAGVVTTEQVLNDLADYKRANPHAGFQVDKLTQAIHGVEGETLIKGKVPADAVSAPNRQHLKMIRKAEEIYSDAKAGGGSTAEVIQRAEPGLRALEEATEASSRWGSTLSHGSKALGVLGVGVSVYEVGHAAKKSVDQGSAAPLAAETVRQAGGWASAWAGAQAGAALGAAAGIETGPGAVVTGLVGGIVGGAIGFFFADAVADQIDEN